MFSEERETISRLEERIEKCQREVNRTGEQRWKQMLLQREEALIDARKDLLKKLIRRKESYGRDYARESAAAKQFDRRIEEQREALEGLTPDDDVLTIEIGDMAEVEI